MAEYAVTSDVQGFMAEDPPQNTISEQHSQTVLEHRLITFTNESIYKARVREGANPGRLRLRRMNDTLFNFLNARMCVFDGAHSF